MLRISAPLLPPITTAPGLPTQPTHPPPPACPWGRRSNRQPGNPATRIRWPGHQRAPPAPTSPPDPPPRSEDQGVEEIADKSLPTNIFDTLSKAQAGGQAVGWAGDGRVGSGARCSKTC